MKYAYAAFSSVVLAAAIVAVSSCSDPIDCTDRRDCPSDFDSGAGRTGNDAGAPGAMDVGGSAGVTGAPSEAGAGGSAGATEVESCDPNADPATTACVIADQYGTFVAPYGNDDTADGSQAKPFATVTKALSAVAEQKRARIYVCAAEYSEPDTITPLDGSSIFGGFSCDGGAWAYDAPVKALLTIESPVAAIIDSAKRGVTLEDVRLDAADAPQNDTGASSFGLVVNASKAIALVRVELHAGKGGGGRPGVTPDVPMAPVSTSEQDGRAAVCAAVLVPPTAPLGGFAAVSKCGTGGRGGIGYGTFDHSGASGSPTTNLVSVPQPNGGAAITAADPAGIAARPGGAGLDGAAGTFGNLAGAVGSFGPAGYVGAAGGNGTNGGAGQGGGGGGASKEFSAPGLTCDAAGGGAGGAGGCGGSGGAGGGGGGASVGMLSWNSDVTLDAVVLISMAGGAGGKGATGLAGGIGSEGGKGGVGNGNGAVLDGGHGGKGGNGGVGGPGAGGTGGPSLGLVYNGVKPIGVSGCVLTPGIGGAAGPGGLGATPSSPAPNGLPGIARGEYPVH